MKSISYVALESPFSTPTITNNLKLSNKNFALYNNVKNKVVKIYKLYTQ